MKQKCSLCKLIFEEHSCSFYRRTHLKKGHLLPFCRDCKRISFLLKNPDIAKQQEEKIAKRQERRHQVKMLKKFARDVVIKEPWFQDLLDKKRKSSRHSSSVRRLRELNVKLDLTKDEKIAVKEFYFKCPEDMEVDHIIPISKGGTHCLENLQYLSKRENVSKLDKISYFHIKKVLKEENISIGTLCRKFKIKVEDATKIYAELIDFGLLEHEPI